MSGATTCLVLFQGYWRIQVRIIPEYSVVMFPNQDHELASALPKPHQTKDAGPIVKRLEEGQGPPSK